jgi:predicted nucleic acid-binding protein
MVAYILDTNILREMYVSNPNEKFKSWFTKQDKEDFHITTFNVAEIRYGIEKLPQSKKRQDIESWLDDILLPNFNGRILTFDLKSAQAWGVMAAQNTKTGRPRPHMDSLLASIALAHDMVLVTRNIKDFSGLGIELVNPFGDHK